MQPDVGRRRAFAIPLIVWLATMAGLAAAWWALDNQWRRNVDQQLHLTTSQAALRLGDFLHARVVAVQSIGDYLDPTTETFEVDFVARSQSLQRAFRGFQALNWIDPDGVIEVAVPLEPNLDALGANVLTSPVAAVAFRQASITRVPQMTAPVDLFQGGRGVATYFPTVRGQKVLGFFNAVFRIDALVENSLHDGMLDSHALLISDGTDVVYQSPDLDAALRRPRGVAHAGAVNRNWTLTAYPDDELWATMRAGRPLWIFVSAFGLATLACWLLRGALLRTYQRAIELRQNEEFRLEVERSAKMQALGRLAGGVAHDFNNILTAIIGNAEIIRLTAGNSIIEQASQDIVIASERASDLTRQLLVFANQRQTETVSIDLNEQVADLRAMLSRLLSETISLEIELAEDLPAVMSSRGQISQILVNLAVNAADAMPDGGRLRIATRSEPGPAADESPGQWIVLSVSDTGTGMDAATRARIFEPFYTTKGDSHKGAGLGLATVYGIVLALGGDLRVKSKPGSGTCFEVWLPASVEAVPKASTAPKLALSGNAKCVLFVEDNDSVREAVAATLRHYGHTVVTAVDGQRALDLLDAEGADTFDVIVTDAVMPGLSGPQLARTLRSRGELLPLIICSGYSEELSETSALAEIGVDFLAKPYAIEDLLALVDARPLPG